MVAQDLRFEKIRSTDDCSVETVITIDILPMAEAVGSMSIFVPDFITYMKNFIDKRNHTRYYTHITYLIYMN